MTEYFYHAYIYDDDYGIGTDLGYFHSFTLAFQECVKYNDKIGIISENYNTLFQNIRKQGIVYCGYCTIERCKFED